jgi:hypothetical protein
MNAFPLQRQLAENAGNGNVERLQRIFGYPCNSNEIGRIPGGFADAICVTPSVTLVRLISV